MKARAIIGGVPLSPEWFIAPLSVIEESIELIISGEIVNFTYDDESKLICNRQ